MVFQWCFTHVADKLMNMILLDGSNKDPQLQPSFRTWLYTNIDIYGPHYADMPLWCLSPEKIINGVVSDRSS